jgi:hypothetical protein
MIKQALSLIRDQLNQHLPTGDAGPVAVLGDIAQNDQENGDGGSLVNRVVITLVNVEQETTLKNIPSYQKTLNGIRYQNAPVYLNLYVLISANYPNNYEDALARLSHVIEFFQFRNVINLKNSPESQVASATNPDELDLELILDLYTISFEQLNHLWGALGGKQKPFVLYKVRLIMVRRPHTLGTGALIEEIQGITRSIQQ